MYAFFMIRVHDVSAKRKEKNDSQKKKVIFFPFIRRLNKIDPWDVYFTHIYIYTK